MPDGKVRNGWHRMRKKSKIYAIENGTVNRKPPPQNTKKPGIPRNSGPSLWQGQKDSNPRHAVLETAALPAELYPYRLMLHYYTTLRIRCQPFFCNFCVTVSCNTNAKEHEAPERVYNVRADLSFYHRSIVLLFS